MLATTSPTDLVTPLAEALGFDDVIATRYAEHDGRYTGRLDGPFVWGMGKRTAAARVGGRARRSTWPTSHAYSDSVFDLPLLRAVGHPHPVNADPRLAAVALARRWPLETLGPPPGGPLGGRVRALPPGAARSSGPRPSPTPASTSDGVEHIPDRGPVLLAANHRSYFDVAALAIVAARLGRPVRFLAKRELFDAPVVGPAGPGPGRHPGRPGQRARRDPMRRAAAALRAGEVVIVLPQGTIPRGEAFFDPVLVGQTGAARLAAETGAPVVPIGLWGTERVWPRSSRVPNMPPSSTRPG